MWFLFSRVFGPSNHPPRAGFDRTSVEGPTHNLSNQPSKSSVLGAQALGQQKFVQKVYKIEKCSIKKLFLICGSVTPPAQQEWTLLLAIQPSVQGVVCLSSQMGIPLHPPGASASCPRY
jgi:hypothetical protein